MGRTVHAGGQAGLDRRGVTEVIWELYGAPNTGVDVHLRHAVADPPGSVGVVVRGEMKVLDDDGNPCSPAWRARFIAPSRGSDPTYRMSV